MAALAFFFFYAYIISLGEYFKSAFLAFLYLRSTWRALLPPNRTFTKLPACTANIQRHESGEEDGEGANEKQSARAKPRYKK